MRLDVRRFLPDEATETELGEFHALIDAAYAVDRPELAPVTRAFAESLVRSPVSPSGTWLYWTARGAGELVGFAALHLPAAPEHARLGTTSVIVAPARRRQGIGTRILRAVLPELRAHGRQVVAGRGMTAGGAGEDWARGLGFAVVNRQVTQRLVVSPAKRARWNVDAPPGYRLVRWTGGAPEDRVDAVARVRRALEDAPRGDSRYLVPHWDAARVRRAEQDYAERGFEHFVVAALDEAGGELVAITELIRHPSRPGEAVQQDTAVLAGHRGRGLGVAVKASLMSWLVEVHPEVASVRTITGGENRYMIDVNLRLGYETVREWCDVEADIDDLTVRLGAARDARPK
jgi:mycothiol synthase